MPNVDIVCVSLDPVAKRSLNSGLTQVFCDKAGCGVDAVHLRYHEVPLNNYVVGGKFTNQSGAQPPVFEINVAWYAGRTPEMHDAVAEGLTEVASKALSIDPGTVEVNFRQLEPSSHYEGGRRAPAPR
jgi:phenylpyruvate tautomerase PptA (4-oxalocrotonate tautomerase family)